MSKPLLLYCYDAYCGWCYGFSTVINRIASEYDQQLSFEVFSGGMILPEQPRPIGVMAPYIQQAYKTVEERTGIVFGPDFLWHIFNPDKSDWFPDSEKPAIAMCILKEYLPERQIEFATDLHYALNYEGRDLTDDEAYRHLLEKYGLKETDFYARLKSEEYQKKAHDEFAMVGQLKVTGFPTVFIQAQQGKYYLVARGYTPYETFKTTLDSILQSITTDSSS